MRGAQLKRCWFQEKYNPLMVMNLKVNNLQKHEEEPFRLQANQFSCVHAVQCTC